MKTKLAALAALLLASAGTGAARADGFRADLCEAIPGNEDLTRQLEKHGTVFAGRVVHIIDGDSVCVSLGASRYYWVDVRLSDFHAPELRQPSGRAARDALERIAIGRTVECSTTSLGHDSVTATCRIDGRGLGELMTEAGIPQGGRGYKRSF